MLCQVTYLLTVVPVISILISPKISYDVLFILQFKTPLKYDARHLMLLINIAC
jgi:hypothetical protein